MNGTKQRDPREGAQWILDKRTKAVQLRKLFCLKFPYCPCQGLSLAPHCPAQCDLGIVRFGIYPPKANTEVPLQTLTAALFLTAKSWDSPTPFSG